MHIKIVIPTFERLEKLLNCLDSIKNQTYQDFDVLVIADNKDTYTLEKILALNDPKITAIVNDKQLFVTGGWNRAFKEYQHENWDAMMWIVDDVWLHPTCIEEAVNTFKATYENTDGIVGISQNAPGHPEYTWKPFGQILIGRMFVDRYKEVDYKVCNPDYFHFYQDEELHMYATSLNKFILSEKAVLDHYHPAFYHDKIDRTHGLVRKPQLKRQDDAIYRKRRELNLIWGQTWQTLK